MRNYSDVSNSIRRQHLNINPHIISLGN